MTLDNANDISEPSHVTFGREALGVDPKTTLGMEISTTLKSARWCCEVEETYTEPEDDYHVIELKRSGGAILRLDNNSEPILNRTITLGPAASSGLWVSDGIVEFSQLYLSTKTLSEIAESLHGYNDAIEDDELMPEIEGTVDLPLANLVDYCEHVCCMDQYSTQLELDALGQLVGAYIIRNRSRLTGMKIRNLVPTLNRRKLSRILDAIEAQLSSNLTLALLADLSGLSTYHFAKAFKEATNFSPHQYVLERRILRACEKLKNTNESLATVAYDVGFSSQAHMTDVFSKRLGVTPGAYRSENCK